MLVLRNVLIFAVRAAVNIFLKFSEGDHRIDRRPGDPHLAQCGRRNIIVETLINVAHQY